MIKSLALIFSLIFSFVITPSKADVMDFQNYTMDVDGTLYSITIPGQVLPDVQPPIFINKIG